MLSRSALEARTCECYAVVREEYVRLLRDADDDADPSAAGPPFVERLIGRLPSRAVAGNAAVGVAA